MAQFDDDLQVWEYHKDYETWLWYERFRNFYLPQKGRRTVLGAYRAYQLEQTKNDPKTNQLDPDKITAAPVAWKLVAAGGKSSGNQQIAGSVSWAERADSYYMHLERTYEEVMHSRRIDSSVRSLGRLDNLGRKWDEMFTIASTLKRTRTREVPVETVDADGKITVTMKTIETRALAIGDFATLVASHDNMRTQERREMNLPARIYQSNHADSEGGQLGGLLDGGLGEVLASAMQNVQRIRRESDEAINHDED